MRGALILLLDYRHHADQLLQINTGHELVLTELILENFLSGYEPQEVVALLASFVFQERRSETEPVLTDRLKEVWPSAWPFMERTDVICEQGKDRITAIADRVTAVQVAQRANVAEDGAESNNLNFGLSEVVYEWARGMVRHLKKARLYRLTRPLSPSTRSPSSPMSKKAQLFALSPDWMRPVGKCAMLPGSLAMQHYIKRWKPVKLVSSGTLSCKLSSRPAEVDLKANFASLASSSCASLYL